MKFKPLFFLGWPFRYAYRKFIVLLLKRHFNRTLYVAAYIELAKDMIDTLKINGQLLKTIQHKKKLDQLVKENELISKDLYVKKNNLVAIIWDMKLCEHLNLADKDGNPLTKEYLYSLDTEVLIEKAMTILKQIQKLDV